MSTATPETPRAPATPAAPAAKTRAKPKAAPRAAAKKAAPPAPAPAPAPADKDAKPRKPKLVRDSFTIPKDEYAAIDTLKQRTTAQAHPAKKSELLRAGLKLLSGLDDAALLAALQAVPAIKTGRPKASRK
ncbi:hypothetical protein [Acidovorax sp. SDU_ACID1]|uniref:hypothetical protein n=1 Tax=Acidovorax sp. SDU_ACID1 TaxID=3136632 RepID=UPI003872CDD3